MLHVECFHGHVIDENMDECSAGHGSLFRSVKCPIASCGFRSEPRYADIDFPLDKSYNEVKKHFKSVHGYELDSNDLGGDGREVTGVTDVEKNDTCAVNEDGKTDESKEKVAPSKEVEFGDNPGASNILSCPKCFKIMRTKFTLRRHISQVHEDKDKFKCTYCDRSFCAKLSLTYHVKKMHLPFGHQFNCEKCSKICSDFTAFKAHRAEHRVNQEKDILKCHYCDLNIKRTSMNKHITEVHNVEIRYDGRKVSMVYPHKCNKCEFYFKRKFDLKRHQEAKHENQVYGCDLCSKHFKYLTNLRRHVKTVHAAGQDGGKQDVGGQDGGGQDGDGQGGDGQNHG